jgi:hypothetical protein
MYSMTPKAVQLRLYGIMKKRIEDKRNMRNMVYAIHVHNVEQKNRLEIWDLLPLEGDPTPKQRAAEQRKRDIAEAKKLQKQTANAIDIFRAKGLLN